MPQHKPARPFWVWKAAPKAHPEFKSYFNHPTHLIENERERELYELALKDDRQVMREIAHCIDPRIHPKVVPLWGFPAFYRIQIGIARRVRLVFTLIQVSGKDPLRPEVKQIDFYRSTDIIRNNKENYLYILGLAMRDQVYTDSYKQALRIRWEQFIKGFKDD